MTPWFPYPATNGARVRSSKLLAALHAAGYRCHLFSLEPAPPHHASEEAPLSSITVGTPAATRRGRARSLLALLGPRPRHFRLSYDPLIQARIEQAAIDHQASVVVAFELTAGDYVSRLDGGRFVKILDGCEPFMFRSPSHSLRSQARMWKLKRFLRQMLRRFDAYIAVSDAELTWIRREVTPHGAYGRTVPNGADRAEAYRGAGDPNRVIYTGSLRYEANLKAVELFIGTIWPLIRRDWPSAQFVVSGQLPDELTVGRLQATPGVVIAGLLDDYQRFVGASAVLAVPLMHGGGTRIKILEALALGCPVVATSKAVEGLTLVAGEEIVVADRPVDFATSVVSLLRDAGLRRRLIANGRRAAERYSWSAAQQTFVELVDSSLQRRSIPEPA